MSLPVVFAPEAQTQLTQLYRFVARKSYPSIAARYTEAIVSYCESLTTFPERGLRRDDIRPGLRISHYRGRTVIAFTVQLGRVEIIGIFHGGRDYIKMLHKQAGSAQMK